MKTEATPVTGNEPHKDSSETIDLLIVGAGPAGLHAACIAQESGLSHLIVDRRGLAHSFVEYPQCLRFFSPPDEMAVGSVPFPMRGGDKPTREDILPYFRAVAASRGLNVALWEQITEVNKEGNLFHVQTLRQPNEDVKRAYRARFLLLTSGVWDESHRLGCPGADLPHVHYRFVEPTEYFGMDVLVVGGGNSAVHAALALAEAHARVTLAMRRSPVAYQSHLRPFVVRDLQFAVDEGKVTLITDVSVARIEPEQTWLQSFAYDAGHLDKGVTHSEANAVPARFVFALLGQRADTTLFHRLGLCLEPDGRPTHDPQTFETNIPDIFVAGSLAGEKIDLVITGRQQAARVVKYIAERIIRP